MSGLHPATFAVLARSFVAPEPVAAAIAFLASDEASLTTGQVLQVDGGALL